MKKLIHFILLLLVFLQVSVPAKNILSVMDNLVQDGVVIVKFKTDPALTKAANSDFAKILAKHGISEFIPVVKNSGVLLKNQHVPMLHRIYYAYYAGDQSPVRVAAELKLSSPDIEYAEPKYLHQLSGEPLLPNDTFFNTQYGLRKTYAPQAWNLVRGEQGNVVIAIVDGGTEINHPDLHANLWINPGEIPDDGIDNDDNGFVDDVHGWSFAADNNDPTGLPSTPINANHGTHTAGIASAVTDNSIGVAGTSWNASIMPINAGSSTSDNSIAFSYDGILYAALNGADIISCSWGRGGSASQYEQDVIDQAAALGAVVVAAAGNDNTDGNYYPAHYKNVFSVAAVDSLDKKASFTNYGPKVDVSAPGVSIESTRSGGNYGMMSGTSMACPLAAGIIALVKTQNESWNGLQAAEQVRISADNIDTVNPDYAGMLGGGRINAESALIVESPAIRISDLTFTDDDGNGNIEPGDYVDVFVRVKNYLKPASAVLFDLSITDPYISLLNAANQIEQIGTLEEYQLAKAFSFQVASDAPTGHIAKFRLNITSASYVDRDYFNLMILPTFAAANVNNINVTITNIGRIGFADIDLTGSGTGFLYKNGTNLLFEGAIITGIAPNRISNAARGLETSSDLDFEVAKNGDLELRTPGTVTSQESKGKFEDIYASTPIPVRITQRTYASTDPDMDDFILFKYDVLNTGSTDIQNLYFGLFFDWDLDSENYVTNIIDFDPTRNLGYVYDTGDGPDTYAGVSLLTEQNISYRAIFNDESAPGNPSWGIYDNFTDAEKWEAISGGVVYTQAGPEDVSQVIAAGPVNLSPGEQEVVVFAMLAGDNLVDLQNHADSAQIFWQQLKPLDIDHETKDNIVREFALMQNYPNPFNPLTKIEFTIPNTSFVILEIFNSLGEKVADVISKNLNSGRYEVIWNARNLASGVYFYQLRAGDFVQRRKMLLLK